MTAGPASSSRPASPAAMWRARAVPDPSDAASTLTAGRPSNSRPAPITASVLAPTSTPGAELRATSSATCSASAACSAETKTNATSAAAPPRPARTAAAASAAQARASPAPARNVHRASHRRHSMILQSVETSAVVEAEMKQSRSAFGVSSRAAPAWPPDMRT